MTTLSITALSMTTLSITTFSMMILSIKGLYVTLSINNTKSITDTQLNNALHFDECHYAECHVFIVMFSVIKVTVVMLSVLAPFLCLLVTLIIIVIVKKFLNAQTTLKPPSNFAIFCFKFWSPSIQFESSLKLVSLEAFRLS
jgi:hypothetical protein